MGRLRYTLVADGSSDRSLVPILTNGREPLNLPSVETLEAQAMKQADRIKIERLAPAGVE